MRSLKRSWSEMIHGDTIDEGETIPIQVVVVEMEKTLVMLWELVVVVVVMEMKEMVEVRVLMKRMKRSKKRNRNVKGKYL